MKQILIFLFVLSSTVTFACHDVSFVETAAVDNGDGTYTYTFEICLGEGDPNITDETYGFYLDFTGGNLIDYNDSIIGPSTGNVKYPSVPPISGVGDIEYGDWDDDTTPILSGVDNDCILITLTFDTPISSATLGGYQPNYCTGDTETVNTTSCFPSNATYQIEVDLAATCNGNPSYFIDLDGTIIDSGPVDGSTVNLTYCGACATEFSAGTDKNNCSLNSYFYQYKTDGSHLLFLSGINRE
ncbi:MAG: hypothetical protein ACQERC_06940 [Bacteroidota bacterium]